jgi:hypothetical protein
MAVGAAIATGTAVLATAGAGLLPLLPRAALPKLAATTHPVTAHDLAADLAGGAAFTQRLRSWGFEQGRERDFQGESKTIDHVVSRTLAFASGHGAHAYVRYVGSHAVALYGAGSSARPVVSRGRSGYLVEAAPCACHRASPTLLAVVARGTRVTWLEANGGSVKPALVASLLARAP